MQKKLIAAFQLIDSRQWRTLCSASAIRQNATEPIPNYMAPKGLIMPIANCIITQECSDTAGSLIELWAKASGVSAEHMTINIICSHEQLGKQYKIMSNLTLPSMWSKSNISSLQMGLATALSQHFLVDIKEVQVVTNIVTSGLVVESGKEISW